MVFSSVLFVLLVLFSPAIVLSNLLILSAWIRYKRLRTPSNIFIVSLSSCDLGLGLLIPFSVAIDLSQLEIDSESTQSNSNITFNNLFENGSYENMTLPNQDLSICDDVSFYCFHLLLILILSSTSLLSITSISIDRFLSVSQPLRYNHFVTMSHVQRFIFLCWIYSFVMSILPIYTLNQIDTKLLILNMSLFVYIPCLLFVIGSYSYIYVIARSHAKQIFSVEISLHSCGVIGMSDMSQTVVTHTSGQPRYGLTLTFLIVSVLCWAPIQICASMDTLWNSVILNERHWRILALMPVALSILVNPWLYAYRSSEVRNAVIRILDTIICKLTGHSSYPIFYQNKNGEMTSYGSNVRLLAISPTQTTVHCSHGQSGTTGGGGVSGGGSGSNLTTNGTNLTPSPTTAARNEQADQNHLQILLCNYQVSSL